MFDQVDAVLVLFEELEHIVDQGLLEFLIYGACVPIVSFFCVSKFYKISLQPVLLLHQTLLIDCQVELLLLFIELLISGSVKQLGARLIEVAYG